MFKDVTSKIKTAVGENRTEMIVSKSIFIVCIGSDDIANTYFTTPFRKPHYDIPAYTDLMANSASSFLQVCFELLIRNRIRVHYFPLCFSVRDTYLSAIAYQKSEQKLYIYNILKQ